MCSTALVIQPPAVAGADAAAAPAAAATSADSKKGGAKGKPASQDSKAAGAAAAKPRPGEGENTGCLQACRCQARANVACKAVRQRLPQSIWPTAPTSLEMQQCRP